MAENPIKKTDIIDGEAIRDEIQGLLGDLLKLAAVLQKDIVQAAAKAKAGLEGVDITTKQGRKQVKDVNKEVVDLTRQYNTMTRSIAGLEKQLKETNAEVNVEKGSYYDLAKQMSLLEKQAKATADKGLRNALSREIRGMREELKKLDAAMGTHTRNVGNYGKSIIDAGKQLFAFGGIAGGVTIAANKLKDAFMSTSKGMDIMNTATQVLKQNLYDMVTKLDFSGRNTNKAIDIALRQNKIRKGDIIDIVKVSNLENQLKTLRDEEAKIVNDDTKKLEWRNKIIAKEDELIKYKVADAEEEFRVAKDNANARQDDETLQMAAAMAYQKLMDAYDDRNIRLQQRASSAEEKEFKKQEAHKNAILKWHEEIEAQNEKDTEAREKAIEKAAEQQVLEEEIAAQGGRKNYAKYVAPKGDEGVMAEITAAKTVQDEKDRIWNEGMDKARQDFIKAEDEKKKLAQETADKEIQLQEDIRKATQEKRQQALEFMSSAIGSIGDLIEAQKQKELSAAGDNAKERKRIEREYAKKQQAVSISEALINGALAVTNLIANVPGSTINPATWVGIAMAAAQTALQIGIISSQKFAEGGLIEGRPHSAGGEMIEAEGGEYVINKHSTNKYKDLVAAINADNPMKIADEIRNRQFHTVWGGVQADLTGIQKQDPYTKMMYELMKKSVTTYTDTNGDTVLRFADGSTRIIRKYQN